MPRARKGAARRQSKNRVMKSARGFRGARRKTWRRVQEAVLRSGAASYRDRRRRKRDMRRLWIIRVTAAARLRDMRYSQFIAGLKAAGIELNRKMLSEIAIADPKGFDAIADQAKAALDKKQAA